MMLFCFADMKNYRRKLQEMARESSYEYFPRVAEMPKDYARYTVEMLIVRQLLNRKCAFTLEALESLFDWLAGCLQYDGRYGLPFAGVLSAVERYLESNELSEGLALRLTILKENLESGLLDDSGRRLVARIERVFEGNASICINAGDPWADAAIAYFKTLSESQRQPWSDLLKYCYTSSSSKPNQKWLQQANTLIEAVGRDAFYVQSQAWLSLVDKPRTSPRKKTADEQDHQWLMDDTNADLLKGIIWCYGIVENTDNAHTIVRTALSCYKKIPGIGPRSVRLGNACIAALATMPGQAGLYQLAVLQVKLKNGSALKLVKQALQKAAAREGLAVTELEEMGVPSYGLDEVGYGEEQVGGYTAVIAIHSLNEVELTWRTSEGKIQKTIPAVVASDHADDLKSLRGVVKDIKTMLSVQKDRIEQLYLKAVEWPCGVWLKRYIEHPLVGVISRRLIWHFSNGSRIESAFYHEGQWLNHRGEPLAPWGDDWTVSLWHPVHADIETILGWRRFIETAEITQPFKQAHREVYLLTDAERNTHIYSNRFAAHIIKQHQFSALCRTRGWRYALLGNWDGGDGIARRDIDALGLWAEFWVYAIGEYERETTTGGGFTYLSTDQVRFYNKSVDGNNQTDLVPTEPIEIENIPPLILSEIFRDVDLFVGVCSVGNDPQWTDGGPDDTFFDYWHNQSFGELSATAETRRAILQNLLPKLKVRDKCALMDRFLVVQGTRRIYKIHLGSGNILMEPDNQYLCIVPDNSKLKTERVLLPFEGDNMLSIILSKAALLAEDHKIKDATINSQINANNA